jgi:kynurenine formamidase
MQPNQPTQYRAEVDARITFLNGGGLTVEGFRVDAPGPDVTQAAAAELLVSSLGLLMTENVEIQRLDVIEEAHKGTRGGPSDPARQAEASSLRHIELSHVISDGLITYPGLPGPEITPHLTREDSRARYDPGTEFAIDRITMVGNTGTYLDSPFHRYADGTDLAGLPLESLVDLPVALVRVVGGGARGVDVGALAAHDVKGCAVLLHTGGDVGWATDDYAKDAPFLTEAGARWLVERQARLVGIDSVNIDDMSGGSRPAHSLLLAAGIPVVEHLTNLDQVPAAGARFTAAPPLVRGFGTFPVRAYLTVA